MNTPPCDHRYLTVTRESGGWFCCDCKVRVLSLMLPIPVPLIERALDALTDNQVSKTTA